MSLTPYDGAASLLALRRRIAAFRGGHVVIGTPEGPYKCPPAPYEYALAWARHLRARGLRGRITLVDPRSRPTPLALAPGLLRAIAAHRDVLAYEPFTRVLSVDPAGRTVETEVGRLRFDLLSLVPPHRLPRFLADAGLGDPFVEVDAQTFRTLADDRDLRDRRRRGHALRADGVHRGQLGPHRRPCHRARPGRRRRPARPAREPVLPAGIRDRRAAHSHHVDSRARRRRGSPREDVGGRRQPADVREPAAPARVGGLHHPRAVRGRVTRWPRPAQPGPAAPADGTAPKRGPQRALRADDRQPRDSALTRLQPAVGSIDLESTYPHEEARHDDVGGTGLQSRSGWTRS